MNEQYEFLRRTLSHSQRRYSQRGRKPREKKAGLGRGGQSLRIANSSGSSVVNGGSERALNGTTEESRQKRTIGQLRDITLNGVTDPSGGDASLETHVDQHGRTYYMDHSTRTIAFDRSANVEAGGAVGELEIQTRREMLDRR